MIEYVKGDATYPIMEKGNNFILHVCNNVGAWGAGFVLALSKRWDMPEALFRSTYPPLGTIQCCQVDERLFVVNMVAMAGLRSKLNPSPLNYDTLSACLRKVNIAYGRKGAAFHMPKIGAGLAGGDWATIENIIWNELGDHIVKVYELE